MRSLFVIVSLVAALIAMLQIGKRRKVKASRHELGASKCTDPEIGDFIVGAYKYRLFSDEGEEKRFKEHARKCAYCASKLKTIIPCNDVEVGKYVIDYTADCISDRDRTRFVAHARQCKGCMAEIRNASFLTSYMRYVHAERRHNPLRELFCPEPKWGNRLTEYRFNLLSPKDRKRFESHLGWCDSCTTMLRRGPHCINPSLGVQLVDYMFRIIPQDVRARFEVHLIRCAYCTIELSELAPFVKAFQDEPGPPCECHPQEARIQEQITSPNCPTRRTLFRYQDAMRRICQATRRN